MRRGQRRALAKPEAERLAHRWLTAGELLRLTFASSVGQPSTGALMDSLGKTVSSTGHSLGRFPVAFPLTASCPFCHRRSPYAALQTARSVPSRTWANRSPGRVTTWETNRGRLKVDLGLAVLGKSNRRAVRARGAGRERRQLVPHCRRCSLRLCGQSPIYAGSANIPRAGRSARSIMRAWSEPLSARTPPPSQSSGARRFRRHS